jgi:hypothetical protein
MVPVWRVFENPRISQLVYTISVVAGVAAGVWRLGWWGVPVGVVVVLAFGRCSSWCSGGVEESHGSPTGSGLSRGQ